MFTAATRQMCSRAQGVWRCKPMCVTASLAMPSLKRFSRSFWPPIFVTLLAAGCGSGEPREETQGVTAQELTERERIAVLDVVNSASFEELDVEAALDRR